MQNLTSLHNARADCFINLEIATLPLLCAGWLYVQSKIIPRANGPHRKRNRYCVG
jgi:hypothetical protein